MARYTTNRENNTRPLVPGTMGNTIKIHTVNEQIMSDVWEDVTYAFGYDPTLGTFRNAPLGRGEYAEEDASDEVLALHEEWLTRQKAAKEALQAYQAADHRAREAAVVRHGRTVEVFKGRKVAKGTQGVVCWVGETRWGWSVGIKVDGSDKLTFTDKANVRVVGTEILDLAAEVAREAHIKATKHAQAPLSTVAAAALYQQGIGGQGFSYKRILLYFPFLRRERCKWNSGQVLFKA